MLVDIANPSPQVCLTHKGTLDQEDEIISTFLDALPPKDESLENKELNQVNTFHVSSYDKPGFLQPHNQSMIDTTKPKRPNVLKVAKYICERGAMER